MAGASSRTSSISVGGELCAARCIHPDAVAAAQLRLADGSIYRAVADLFGALADPTRAKLVHVLIRHELCTCDLAAVLGISESGVSQHLRILRALRLVKARRQGKFVYYTLDDAHVALLLQLGLTHAGHTDMAEIAPVADAAGA
jgi:ArsR family transcriptional regulator, lead/cadmium/zinc/bismuth-responsive transcriptional repressor